VVFGEKVTKTARIKAGIDLLADSATPRGRRLVGPRPRTRRLGEGGRDRKRKKGVNGGGRSCGCAVQTEGYPPLSYSTGTFWKKKLTRRTARGEQQNKSNRWGGKKIKKRGSKLANESLGKKTGEVTW